VVETVRGCLVVWLVLKASIYGGIAESVDVGFCQSRVLVLTVYLEAAG
jgi:hypothetical protein